MQGDRISYVARNLDGDDRENLLVAKKSGLIDALNKTQLLPMLQFDDNQATQVLTVVREFINSAPPCEWTQGMFIDAAICTLKVQQVASEFGFALRDAHFQNVVFSGSQPIFIDLNSFVPSGSADRWAASGEYRSEIKRPLKLIQLGRFSIVCNILLRPERLPRERLWTIQYPNIYRLCRLVKLDKWLVNLRERLALIGIFNCQNLLIHISNSSLNEFVIRSKQLRQMQRWQAFIVKSFAGLIASKIEVKPQREISRLEKSLSAKDSGYWSNYYEKSQHWSKNEDISRFEQIQKLIIELNPTSITDIGGNNGKFINSVENSQKCIKKVLIDADEISIEFARRNIRDDDPTHTFGVVDVAYPSLSNNGSSERYVSECACALALTHHLVLRYRLTFDEAVERLKAYTTKYLLVEFMPLGLWDGNSSPPVPNWYNQENFVKALSKHFLILQTHYLNSNRVLIVAQVVL